MRAMKVFDNILEDFHRAYIFGYDNFWNNDVKDIIGSYIRKIDIKDTVVVSV